MSDILSSLTAFDYVAFTIIIISALMSFGRGFFREIASALAFVVAGFAAIAAYKYLVPIVSQYVDFEPWLIGAVTCFLTFIVVYSMSAWIGRSMRKFVQAVTDIGMMDRLLGFAFGALRGLGIVILMLVLAHIFIAADQGQAPDEEGNENYVRLGLDWVEESVTYHFLKDEVVRTYDFVQAKIDERINEE